MPSDQEQIRQPVAQWIAANPKIFIVALQNHLWLTGVALSAVLLIALPLGLLLTRQRRFANAAMAIVNILRTVPSLALLVIMLPLLGCLIWQKDDKLRLSLDRADLWDLRPMKGLDRPEFSYQWVAEQVAKGNYGQVQEYFDRPYDREAGPTKLPGAALETGKAGSGAAELDIATGLGRIAFSDGPVVRVFRGSPARSRRGARGRPAARRRSPRRRSPASRPRRRRTY